MQIVGSVIAIIGALFLLLGAIGSLRMPDTFNRIQAGTKATTLGTILFLTGSGIYHPDGWPKLVLLVFFVMLTNPVSSHVLARAAHFMRVPLAERTVMDALGDRNGTEE